MKLTPKQNEVIEQYKYLESKYGKYFTSTTSIQLCDKCYKEFMRTYLHENN